MAIPLVKGANSPLTGPDDPRHGHVATYRYWDCRCQACKAAHAVVNSEWVEANTRKPVPQYIHGTVNGYNNYRCRCAECSEAASEYHKARRYRLAQAPAQPQTVITCDLGFEHIVERTK